ncbi:IS3 family transposase [Streptomyces sp. ActVer]|uniref:IS3 family transposase n=1 Tax=Streptomyces sp. ActVer TaxID=3014558 RepID=UPI0022B455EE|nr:IS3 family transposase [Streptomyces sp. ActVer]MCZ4507444.1 IS3 family transposase [Streptomyces sp. ActVer]
MAVGVISSCKAGQKIPYRTACRALGVSESWFYKWRDRPPTAREMRRQRLAEEIEEIFRSSGGTYGSPKVFIELIRRGWRVSVNTVAKLMAEIGLAGREIRRRRGQRAAAPDFVHRDFTAEEPDLVWAGDMTEIDTGGGKLYLATVIDLFSRRLLGYAMGVRHDAELVVASLNMAAATRGGNVRGVIMHTDRGSEYCSRRFRRACRRLGVTQSMGRVGSCFDNAVSEAFNSVLKVEYVHRQPSPPAPRPGSGSPPGSPTPTTPGGYTAYAGSRARSTTNASTEPPSPRDWPHRSSPHCEGIDTIGSRIGGENFNVGAGPRAGGDAEGVVRVQLGQTVAQLSEPRGCVGRRVNGRDVTPGDLLKQVPQLRVMVGEIEPAHGRVLGQSGLDPGGPAPRKREREPLLKAAEPLLLGRVEVDRHDDVPADGVQQRGPTQGLLDLVPAPLCHPAGEGFHLEDVESVGGRELCVSPAIAA